MPPSPATSSTSSHGESFVVDVATAHPEPSQRPLGGQHAGSGPTTTNATRSGSSPPISAFELFRAKPSELDEGVQRPAGRPPLLLERPVVVGVLGGPDRPQQAYLVRFLGRAWSAGSADAKDHCVICPVGEDAAGEDEGLGAEPDGIAGLGAACGGRFDDGPGNELRG